MNKVIKIYCEGKAGSSDFDLIEKTIDGLPVIISPIGGKRGAKSAIQVHESGTAKSNFKMFFRDRDFDAPVPDVEGLIRDGSYVYYSYRTTIENYLIDLETVESYSTGKGWNSESLRNDFYNAAKNIKYFQAMRHTLGKMRVPTDFGTNIMEKSGQLPESLEQEYCRERGFAKIEQSIEKTNTWNKVKYDAVFDEFINLFSDEFIEADRFLIYFQGKDFMKSLCRELPGFSPKDYYNFAKVKFDYTRFADFREMRTIIESKI